MYVTKLASVGIFLLAVSSSLISCESTQDQRDNNAMDAELRQNDDQNNQGNNGQVHADFATFRADANVKIAENERKIATLKTKLANTEGEAPLDNMRANKIDALEKQNANLRLRLDEYERNPSDWERFKSEFNHDMNNFSNAFEDLGKDNVDN